MRGRMSPATNYTKGVAIGEVMQGGGVGEVVASNHPAWKVGDVAESMSFGWQEWSVLTPDIAGPAGVNRIDPGLAPEIASADACAGAATSLRLIIGEQSTPEHVEQTNRDAQFAPKNGHSPSRAGRRTRLQSQKGAETIPRVYLADLTRPVHSLELARSATTCSRVWRAVPAQTRTQ